jgi:hypothetical protein
MAESSVMNVEWETNWSYRQADVKAGDVNHALWFQLVTVGLLTLMFCIVSWKKTLTKKGLQTLEMVYEHGCKATMFNQGMLSKYPTLLRPCIIITRTVASLFVSIAIVELIIFNAIANYVKGINAGSSLIVLFFGMLFHLCVLTFKFKKPAHDGPMIAGVAQLRDPHALATLELRGGVEARRRREERRGTRQPRLCLIPLVVDHVPHPNLFALHDLTSIRSARGLGEVDILVDELVYLRDGGNGGGGEHDGAGGGVGERLL